MFILWIKESNLKKTKITQEKYDSILNHRLYFCPPEYKDIVCKKSMGDIEKCKQCAKENMDQYYEIIKDGQK